MKKRLLTLLCTVLLVGFLSADFANAQEMQEVTIRDLNTYENLTSVTEIDAHPLGGETINITFVVTSYPKSSGLASFSSDPDDPFGGTIGRIHIFITDTSAVELGRDGMSMQIVQGSGTSEFLNVENWSRGDVINATGRLTFFGQTAQFVVDEINENLGNVNEELDNLERFKPLLDPIPLSPAEFHDAVGSNTMSVNLEAYQKYHAAYILIEEGTMANYSGDDERPNFTVNKDGSVVPLRDVSLRYRNDRSEYREGYNTRRPEDGDFIRPPVGSAVNASGFLVMNNFNSVAGVDAVENQGLHIAIMEDGILWITEDGQEFRLENGVSQNGEFEWPVDFEVLASPPQVLDVTLSPESENNVYTPDQTVTVTALTAPPEDDETVVIDSVVVNYTTNSGQQTLTMNNVGNGNYEVDLPELVAFESPTLFVEAFGSNGLAGRFPITGNITFFVDGGTITSIEAIQRTGDDQIGPSPIQGIAGLEYDITATVVSEPADGVIAIHQGPNPWSGIFVGLADNTANLERGDVINITGALVNEAGIANNNNTYTYLTNLEFTLVSSGADLSEVVPVLTTDQFNEPVAPGEAWEGMLVSFENVELTAALSFGEFQFASRVEGTEDLQEGTVIVNDDTRAGSVGETGFPDDVNLHIRLGNVLDRVSGLVTYTFGAPKLIPRDLLDLEGDNFTVPRTVFNLTAPADSAEVGVVEETDIVATWQDLDPRDYDGDTVTYEWVLYTADTTEVVALPSDNDGADAQITLPYNTVDNLLADFGVADGESITVQWNVRVSDGTDTLQVASFIDFDTREGEPTYNWLVLTRGEVTSNEEFADTPRTFELEQNYPNPFNPATKINYAVPQNSHVTIEVFNVLGRRVATLVDREMVPGNYTVNFDASGLSSGMYFYRLHAGNALITKKMTLIK